jgi:hypothetical protein
MEEDTKASRLRRINRRVVWGPRGFTDGETNFSVRDLNYSLKDFEKNNGFRIKPAFTIYSSNSDTGSDTSEGSEDTSKASHPVTREESKEDKKKEKCTVCGKKYSDLTRHRNRVHSQVKFRCLKCPKSYSRMDSLSRHGESHQGNK